ncbi:MAG: rod shape-determining protein MreC [Verrucomicrobiota bacterium]
MNRLNVIIVLLILAVAVVISALGSNTAQRIQAGFLGLVSPFLKTGSAMQQRIGAVGQGLKTLGQLEDENGQLAMENKNLKTTNHILRDLETENNKLRAALEYKQRSVFQLVPARVISRDSSTWWNTVKINRGFEDGVDADQPVLTDVGLVGKTTTVGKNESIVLLVTDEICRVAAKAEGTREQGILSGQRIQDSGTSGEMQLNFLSKTADLQAGQKIYTAGVSGGVFPSGILLGTVKSFKARALDGQALVEPALDLSSVEDVFVVLGAK